MNVHAYLIGAACCQMFIFGLNYILMLNN
jgi:hypothetical protein